MSDMFKNIEKKTGVKMNDIMKVAKSVSNSDLNNEKTIRGLVRQLSSMTGKRVSKSKEDMIVDALTKNKKKIDANTISKMLGK